MGPDRISTTNLGIHELGRQKIALENSRNFQRKRIQRELAVSWTFPFPPYQIQNAARGFMLLGPLEALDRAQSPCRGR